jgi:formylglycine-generating enzyme required for sulfatase activity
MAGKIFISYRRSETAWAARALYERLRRDFGDRVFIDIEGLSLGVDFTRVIDEHLGFCEVMLAVVGHHWLDEVQRRLGDADEPDWVRAEVGRALARNIPVVPVLIEGAALPPRKALPEDLKGLRDRHGLELHARFFDQQVGRLAKEISRIVQAPEDSEALPTQPREGWQDEGSDAYGPWACLELGGVRQRLRWLPAGAFWMGSPDTERGRGDDETLHRVVLSRGFWMAETACTQALWYAVLGQHPSAAPHDLDRPVERVSWNDIQLRFLPALNRMLPGLDARLPTEAQWEYACRAGTSTPFHTGRSISTDQANFDGRKPYADGPVGDHRGQTVPVTSLPPNAWGLHEMHGNVWEWCADGYGAYGAEEAIDPIGAPAAQARVMRGGSWLDDARAVRAASRVLNHQDFRDADVGFRLCRA